MTKDPFLLQDTHAVITGAGTGIGRATAHSLAAAGSGLLYLAGRRQEKLAAVAAEIETQWPRCQTISITADISHGEGRKKIYDGIRQEGGRLDVLVNNAGAFDQKSLAQTPDNAWRESMAVNLDGPFSLIRDLVPFLQQGKNPAIINISSTLAVKPIPQATAYNTAKAGLIQMTKTLALELGEDGIRINCILPAVVETDMYRNRFADKAEYERVIDQMKKLHPLGRVGQPEDIALAVRYLASPAASWMTGVALPVDGGMLCT